MGFMIELQKRIVNLDRIVSSLLAASSACFLFGATAAHLFGATASLLEHLFGATASLLEHLFGATASLLEHLFGAPACYLSTSQAQKNPDLSGLGFLSLVPKVGLEPTRF
jgi:hypothetical protein